MKILSKLNNRVAAKVSAAMTLLALGTSAAFAANPAPTPGSDTLSQLFKNILGASQIFISTVLVIALVVGFFLAYKCFMHVKSMNDVQGKHHSNAMYTGLGAIGCIGIVVLLKSFSGTIDGKNSLVNNISDNGTITMTNVSDT